MTALEVILLICGVVCIAVSYIPTTKVEDVAPVQQSVNTDLTEQQMDEIRQQINEIVKEELADINEKTEASLDKISNTKILEMNEYADTVMGEINRNHNETVFLYDMLNEKAKEIKTTVKDVNITKRQVEKIQAEVTLAPDDEQETPEEAVALEQNKEKTVRDDAKERLSELVRQSNEKARKQGDNGSNGHQAVKLDNMVQESMERNLKEDVTEPIRKIEEDESIRPSKASISDASNVQTESVVAVQQDGQQKEERSQQLNQQIDQQNDQQGNQKESQTTETESDKDRKTSESDAKKYARRGGQAAMMMEMQDRLTAEQESMQANQSQSMDMNKTTMQPEKGVSNKENILRLYQMQMSNKEIAKELNIGVGEVKLVIDLYNNRNK